MPRDSTKKHCVDSILLERLDEGLPPLLVISSTEGKDEFTWKLYQFHSAIWQLWSRRRKAHERIFSQASKIRHPNPTIRMKILSKMKSDRISDRLGTAHSLLPTWQETASRTGGNKRRSKSCPSILTMVHLAQECWSLFLLDWQARRRLQGDQHKLSDRHTCTHTTLRSVRFGALSRLTRSVILLYEWWMSCRGWKEPVICASFAKMLRPR